MPNSAPTDSGLLSVVLPAFNEEEMAPRAADVISALLEQAQIPHELIFVDDGSRDRTWARRCTPHWKGWTHGSRRRCRWNRRNRSLQNAGPGLKTKSFAFWSK